MSNILLSLCIPSYNRGDVLNETLNLLFSNPEFDQNKIEVIVSDNCSTDNTEEVVAKYPLVRYYCNATNVKDYNFSIALSYAQGLYIRLFNDTISFRKNALLNMLNEIEKNIGKNKNLFFYANTFLHNNNQIEINTKIDYLKEVSFYNTWIANFGSWREDFIKIQNKDRYAELQFVQVDWSYRIVENNRKTIICFEDLFDVVTPKKKGGYNIIKTFSENYLHILKQEKINFITYEIEKYRLCRYFIYPWLVLLLITDRQNYTFNNKGVFKIIFKKYWYEPYLYIMLFKFLKKRIKVVN